ncbi:MAG: peptide deformylase [Chlamydiota bacterium]
MILKLVYYKDRILRKKCRLIGEITEEVRQLALDLVESVLEYDGAGLAAPQVGSDVRMFVIRYSNDLDEGGMPVLCSPQIFINPKISIIAGVDMETQTEGCLSIPGIVGEVSRPQKIVVEAMDLEGKVFTEEAVGWRARVIMHENDHLNGTLFIDRVSSAQKKKLKEPLKKLASRF